MKHKQRWLEHGKSLLILLLSVSAVYLLSMTPLIQDSGVLDFFRRTAAETERGGVVTLAAAARPSRMAVMGENGRYGVQYDQAEVDELFAQLGPLLGDALISAEAPERLNERTWKSYLQSVGIYYDFTGAVPLAALGRWLNQEGQCSLTSAARRILLTVGEDDCVLLCYQDADSGSFLACRTGLTFSLHLEPAVSGVAGNNASFAFENDWTSLLHPYTMVTENSGRKVYQAGAPLDSAEVLSQVLAALDYTGRNHASVSDGELYLDGSDRLRIQAGGRVMFNAAQEGKYPVAAEKSAVTAAEAIEASRELTETTIGAFCGDAELYLISAAQMEDGYRVRFGYRLDGSSVWLYDEGWAAEVLIRNGYVTEYTLLFRSYFATGEDALLLSMDRAAAMLPALTQQPCELILRYHDRGESFVEPTWVAD